MPDKDKCVIFTFGGIAVRSEHSRGTVRVRARPFASDSFHGNNLQVTCIQCCTLLVDLLSLISMQDAVLSIPCLPEWDRAASAFDGADQLHREQMWTATLFLQEWHSSLSAHFIVESKEVLCAAARLGIQ